MKYSNWKEFTKSFYEKAFLLSILFFFFAFIVSPNLEVKAYKKPPVKEVEVIDMPDIVEQIQQTVVTKVAIAVEAESEDEIEEDIEIEATIFDEYNPPPPPPQVDDTEQNTGIQFTSYDVAPQLIRSKPPKYPDLARKAGIEGMVILQVQVLENGKVGDVQVLKSLQAGPGGCDESAIDAVKKYRFKPAEQNGQPVAVYITLPFNFTMPE
jgi:protein TonB